MGISPIQLALADCTAGREFHPALKMSIRIIEKLAHKVNSNHLKVRAASSALRHPSIPFFLSLSSIEGENVRFFCHMASIFA